MDTVLCGICAPSGAENYQREIRQFLWSHRSEKETDLVIVSGGKSFNVHQAVILPLSSHLKELLPPSCPCTKPAICLPPFPSHVLTAAIEILYTGTTTVATSQGDQVQVEEVLALLKIKADVDKDLNIEANKEKVFKQVEEDLEAMFADLEDSDTEKQSKKKMNSKLSTASYYVPGFSSNLYSSPVQNFSSFNLPPIPLDVPQQQSDQEWFRDCHQEHPGHQLWDQQQWYLPQFTNSTNLHDELLTKTSSLDEVIQIETLPCVKEELDVQVDSLALVEAVVQINTLPSIKEDLNMDLESSTDVFTEVHDHNNEINPSIASFKDDPKIFQKCEKNDEFKNDLEIIKEIVPELSKFAKDIPLNILKKANEYILHEKEQTHCDLMMGDRDVDVDSSIRTFFSESCGEDKAQAGCSNNSLLGINDMSTITNPSSLDAFSKLLNNNSLTIKRRNLTTKQTKHLINTFKTISSMADKLNVTKVITDRANQLFKTVSEGKKMGSHSFDAIAAACMYIACRQEGTPMTFQDIVAVSAVSMKTITKCYKLILKVHDTHVDFITAADFMARFCETLSLDRDIEKAADFIAKAATDLDIVLGKSPRSVAAASIYMASQASGEKKTLCEIADIARVNYTTIQQCYKLMLARANEILDARVHGIKFDKFIQVRDFVF